MKSINDENSGLIEIHKEISLLEQETAKQIDSCCSVATKVLSNAKNKHLDHEHRALMLDVALNAIRQIASHTEALSGLKSKLAETFGSC